MRFGAVAGAGISGKSAELSLQTLPNRPLIIWVPLNVVAQAVTASLWPCILLIVVPVSRSQTRSVAV